MKRMTVLLALAALGCNQATQAPADLAELAKPAAQTGASIFVASSPLRLAPSDEEQVQRPHAPEGMLVNNFIGMVSRGKMATIRKVSPPWVEVVLDDDAEGWVHDDVLRPAKGVRESTVLQTVRMYRGQQENSEIVGLAKTGDLLFITQPGPHYSKVYLEPWGEGYMDNEALVKSEDDIAVSHMLVHAALSRQMNDLDEVSELFDQARVRYPHSALLDMMADHVDFMRLHPTPHTHHSRTQKPGEVPPQVTE